jgi:hypothetical protein
MKIYLWAITAASKNMGPKNSMEFRGFVAGNLDFALFAVSPPLFLYISAQITYINYIEG